MSIGLDVETWLDEGLIDLVHGGNWLNFETPMRPLIDLAYSHDVPAFPMVRSVSRADGFEDKAVWCGRAVTVSMRSTRSIHISGCGGSWETLRPWLARTELYTWDYLPSQRDESDVLPVVRLTRCSRPLRVTSAGAETILDSLVKSLCRSN